MAQNWESNISMKNNIGKIGFLGAGNMAQALIRGLSKKVHAAQIFAYDIDQSKLKKLTSKLKIKACHTAAELIEKSNIVILATKPQDLKTALKPLKPYFKKHLVISIAAGIDYSILVKLLPKTCKIIRSMPNNPALIGEGITALWGKNISVSERQITEQIFKGAGDFIWLRHESQMDAVTGLSGSGPAYVYQFAKALSEAGVRLGLAKEQANQLTLQTLLGAALTLKQSGQTAEQLIPLVTSKKGTTLAGLTVLKKKKFDQIIHQTVAAATRRSQEIQNELKK